MSARCVHSLHAASVFKPVCSGGAYGYGGALGSMQELGSGLAFLQKDEGATPMDLEAGRDRAVAEAQDASTCDVYGPLAKLRQMLSSSWNKTLNMEEPHVLNAIAIEDDDCDSAQHGLGGNNVLRPGILFDPPVGSASQAKAPAGAKAVVGEPRPCIAGATHLQITVMFKSFGAGTGLFGTGQRVLSGVSFIFIDRGRTMQRVAMNGASLSEGGCGCPGCQDDGCCEPVTMMYDSDDEDYSDDGGGDFGASGSSHAPINLLSDQAAGFVAALVGGSAKLWPVETNLFSVGAMQDRGGVFVTDIAETRATGAGSGTFLKLPAHAFSCGRFIHPLLIDHLRVSYTPLQGDTMYYQRSNPTFVNVCGGVKVPLTYPLSATIARINGQQGQQGLLKENHTPFGVCHEMFTRYGNITVRSEKAGGKSGNMVSFKGSRCVRGVYETVCGVFGPELIAQCRPGGAEDPYEGFFHAHMAVVTMGLGKRLGVQPGCTLERLLIMSLPRGSVSLIPRVDDETNTVKFSVVNWEALCDTYYQKVTCTPRGDVCGAGGGVGRMRLRRWKPSYAGDNTISVTARGSVIVRFSWQDPVQWGSLVEADLLQASDALRNFVADCC